MRDHEPPAHGGRRFGRPLHRAAPALALIMTTLTTGALPARAQTEGEPSAQTRLAPRQTLSIRIGTWDPVEETYRAWEGVGGEYEINPDGGVSLPLAGEIDAAGLTPSDLAGHISARLQTEIGLQGRVETSVEITAFEPIYVLGAVEAPGAYPYEPGLTVLKALGLAGGVRTARTEFLRAERSALGSMGQYRVLELKLLRRLATVARLRAELEESDRIELPAEVREAPMAAELIVHERQIKAARDSAHASRLKQITELEQLLEEQIRGLNAQVNLREAQLGLLRDEASKVTNLVERGLSVTRRQSELERQIADQNVRMLELETARLVAEQRLNEAGRDRLDQINDRRRNLVEALRSEQGEIAELRIKMETEAALYAEALSRGDGFVQMEDDAAPMLRLTREGEDGAVAREVERTDRLEAGDVIEVVLPRLGRSAGAPLSSAPDAAAPGVGRPTAVAPEAGGSPLGLSGLASTGG